jgi:hypothetical protein
MGTNYYWYSNDQAQHCTTCLCNDGLHIGKSSAGWNFLLHIHPNLGVHELVDWRSLFCKVGSCIKNEYGDKIAYQEMVDCITKRSHPKGLRSESKRGKPGKEGTYDLLDFEFS